MNTAAKPQIAAIDLLRFSCAIAVMAYHYSPLASLSARDLDPATAPIPIAFCWSWFGWVGVHIFFVISGYVIAKSAEGATPPAFLRRRMLRLAPAAWICASLTAIVIAGTGTMTVGAIGKRWMSALLFLPTSTPIDGAYWTLSVELSFYLLIAIAIRNGRSSARFIEMIGMLLGLASIAFWLCIVVSGTMVSVKINEWPWWITLLPYGVFFGLGVLLWSIHASGLTPRRAAMAGALFTIACLAIASDARRMPDLPGQIAYPMAPVGVFALSILAILGAARAQAPLTRWIGSARLAVIGLMTYPLYLLHHTVGAALILLGVAAGFETLTAVAVTGALMLGIAWSVTRRIEPPLRRWLAHQVPAPAGPFNSHRDLARDIPPTASPPAG
jgi:peptidoglycan/LPS O-acetylase OafA/YrhL